MKKGTLKDRIIKGRKIPMWYLGKGMFCEAWHSTEDGLVYTWHKLTGTHDDTGSKEAIGMWADKTNVHVPSIECLTNEDIRGNEYSVFRMPFYQTITAKHNPEAWAQRKILEKIYGGCWIAAYDLPSCVCNRTHTLKSPSAHDLHNLFRDALHDLTSYGDFPKSLVTAIENMSDAVLQYGDDYYWEFNKANIGVDNDGNLVLRDVLYSERAAWAR